MHPLITFTPSSRGSHQSIPVFLRSCLATRSSPGWHTLLSASTVRTAAHDLHPIHSKRQSSNPTWVSKLMDQFQVRYTTLILSAPQANYSLPYTPSRLGLRCQTRHRCMVAANFLTPTWTPITEKQNIEVSGRGMGANWPVMACCKSGPVSRRPAFSPRRQISGEPASMNELLTAGAQWGFHGTKESLLAPTLMTSAELECNGT